MNNVGGLSVAGGWRVQRESYRYNSLNRMAVLLALILAFSGLIFLLLSPTRIFLRGARLLSISLQSRLAADYSADLRALLPPVNLGLIEEALGDRNNPDDAPGLIDALNTPVPTVTPASTLPGGFFPTPAIFPTVPVLPPGATFTLTPTLITQTSTLPLITPTHTPTGGLVPTTAVPTRTPTPNVPPTYTPTRTTLPTWTWTPTNPPTHTPTQTPVPTETGYPAPPTATWPDPDTPNPTPTDTPCPYC